MALKPDTNFAGKINPATSAYPYGSARNVTVVNDGTGTPFIDLLINDNFGWQQALLDEAGIVPSGSPDSKTTSQYMQAFKKVLAFSGQLVFNSTADFSTGTLANGVVLSDDEVTYLLDNELTVKTNGFYSGSTTGNATYKFLNATDSTSAGYVDGISRFQIRSLDVYTCLDVGDIVEIEQFGASTALADNSTQIQAAIDFSFNLGFGFVKPIHIPSGKFFITGITVKSYITLFGDGDMSILSLPADVPAGTYSIVSIVDSGANSMVLRSFSIWGDNNNQANSPTVYGLDINTATPIIYSRFEQLYIKECQNNALRIRGGGGADNCFFTGCMFRDSKGSANVLIESSDKLSFTQCRFRSGKVGAGHGMLIDNAGSLRVTIDGGCRFDNNNGWAVFASNTSGQIKISDFQAANNRAGGIYLDRSSDSQITDGFLAGNGDTATDAQVKVELSDDVLVDVTIKGGAGYGVHLKNSDDCEVRAKISDRVATTAFAAYIDVCDGTQLSGSIKDCGGNGVFTSNSNEGFYSNLRIKNVGQATNNLYSGVVLDGNSDRNTVQLVKMNSSATNKPQYGVWVANVNANDNVVTNNDLLGYVTAGVQDNGTGTVTTAGNRV